MFAYKAYWEKRLLPLRLFGPDAPLTGPTRKRLRGTSLWVATTQEERYGIKRPLAAKMP